MTHTRAAISLFRRQQWGEDEEEEGEEEGEEEEECNKSFSNQSTVAQRSPNVFGIVNLFFLFPPFFKMRLIWALPEVVTNDIKHVGSSAWKLLVEVDCQSGLRSSSSRAVDGVREKKKER